MTLGVITNEAEQEAALLAGQKVVERTVFHGMVGLLFRIALQRKDRKKNVSESFNNEIIGNFRLF